MSLEELRFASVRDAVQYLAECTSSKIIVASLVPDKDDYVIFFNPRTDYYHVFRFPGSNIREFSKDDSVMDFRTKGQKGQELTFPDSMDPEKVAKEISDMFAGLTVEQRKQMKAEDMRGIYMADSLVSDRPTRDGSNKFDIDFVTDRQYYGIGNIGTLKSKEAVEKEKERRLKQMKKAPKRYKKKVEREVVNPYSEGEMARRQPSREDLARAFGSSDEALQYLADITGKRIVIK